MRFTLLLLFIVASLAPLGATAADKSRTAADAVPPALSYSQPRSFRELAAVPRQADVDGAAEAYAEALAQPLRPASAPEARAETKVAAAQILPLGELGQPPRWAMLLAAVAVALFLARRVTGASA